MTGVRGGSAWQVCVVGVRGRRAWQACVAGVRGRRAWWVCGRRRESVGGGEVAEWGGVGVQGCVGAWRGGRAAAGDRPVCVRGVRVRARLVWGVQMWESASRGKS